MGVVYKLVSTHEAMPYVGKTIQTPKDRFYSHKSDYKRWIAGTQHYKSSYELMKYDDCIMIVLEIDVPDELLSIRENYWWELNSPCVNKCVPNRTPKEYNKQYHQDNRDRQLERRKQYHQDNRDRELERYKQYRQNNREKIAEKIACQCGCMVRRSDIARHKRTSKHIQNSQENA